MAEERDSCRVGVLLVHGIGEQRQFEHLEEVVRNIASVLQADSELSVDICVRVNRDAAYGAEQQTWRAEEIAPVQVEIVDRNGRVTELEFKEVWWADLDEPISWGTILSFWGWSLSLWSKRQYRVLRYGKGQEDMRPPTEVTRKSGISLFDRFYLFLVSFVVFLIVPLLSLLSVLSRNILNSQIRPDILAQYLGDVKLYQQEARLGKGPLVDLGNKPRVSIRRRLIEAFVDMSLDNYDRWYVLSHSQGTVVAFNGLMELESALPNYLNRDLWEKWRSRHFSKTKDPLTPEQARKMLPKRPGWLDLDDIIDRRQLFKNLKGFMTYGSPLSKFAILWPAIVPLNKDESVFQPDFEWVNVLDPTDPVADFTKYFDSQSGSPQSPINPQEIVYKAGQLHLLSHTQYMTFDRNRKDLLVNRVADWLHGGKSFEEILRENDILSRPSWRWPAKSSFLVWFYFFLAFAIWVLLGTIIAIILSYLVPWTLSKFLPELPIASLGLGSLNVSNPLFYFAVSAVVVLISGAIARLFRLN